MVHTGYRKDSLRNRIGFSDVWGILQWRDITSPGTKNRNRSGNCSSDSLFCGFVPLSLFRLSARGSAFQEAHGRKKPKTRDK